METAAIIDFDTIYGASYIYLNGDLNLKQTSPIAYGAVTRAIYNTSIFDNKTDPFDMVSIYQQFNGRNVTVKYDYDKIVYPLYGSNEVLIEINVNYPSYQPVFAYTNRLLVLQNAWDQYICMFIPIAFVIYYFAYFIFRNQVFQTAVVDDLPKISAKQNYHVIN